MRKALSQAAFAALPLLVFGAFFLQAQNVVKVVGERVKLILRSDGTLLGVGRNDYNEISPTPGPVTSPTAIRLSRKAVDVAAGDRSVLVVLDDGSIWAWGWPDAGILGNGGTARSSVPLRVPGINNAVQVVADGFTALALMKDGTVMAWGARNGMTGDGLSPQRYGLDWPGPAVVPIKVPHVSQIKQLSAGGGTVLALTTDGRVLSWGSNHYGALGRPPWQESFPLDTAGEVTGLRDVIAVAAGSGVSTALKRDGTVWVWGSNWQGQFGNGERDGSVGMNVGWYLEPRQVQGVANVVAIAVGLSGRHTLALLKDGSLRGWGNTDWGQLGAGVSGTFQLKPIVPRINGVKAVFASGNNSFAVKNDGTFWAWGIGRQNEWPFTANTKFPTAVRLP